MGYYETDAADPEAPVAVDEYRGIRVGDRVEYVGSIPLGVPGETFTLDALYVWRKVPGNLVLLAAAILNDGEYEVDATNLRKANP